MTSMGEEKDSRDKLLALIKKEVKHVMEEAVTRKFVHEESSSVSCLCSAIDACLSHGLKRRALGLFKTNSTTTALLQKVAKNYEPASLLYVKVSRMETLNDRDNESSSRNNKSANPQFQGRSLRFTWIRVALFEKTLMGIVEHIVANSSKYYEKEGLLSDAVLGEIFASLLIGPCALDYSKIKTQDHFWTDPSADELLQRHRMSTSVVNGYSTPPLSGRKPLGVTYKWSTSSLDFGSKPSSGSDDSTPRGSLACSPRDYVDSLHQNCRSTLLYGKNNVCIQAEGKESLPGYLSLHSSSSSLVIKWTPNHIMNGDSSDPQHEAVKKTATWDLAMSVSLEDVVHLHCHQSDKESKMVLVGQDGVQKPPMSFPRGGHLLAFLACLETGLEPFGKLDPPLDNEDGEGKKFPRLRIRRSLQSETEEEEQGIDYVFRILATFNRPDSGSDEIMTPPKSSPSRWSQWLRSHGTDTSTNKNSATSGINSFKSEVATPTTDKSIQSMCISMKKQIICRAFYGWLTHTRHIKTVRTHLTRLVNPSNRKNSPEEHNYSEGLTKETWESFHDQNHAVRPEFKQKLYNLLYYGGCDHDLRKEVWPYLLGHYKLEMTAQQRKEKDLETREHYEATMLEWSAVAEVVRQRDKEITAANLAKLSSESTTSSDIPPPETRQMSNDVFSESRDDSFKIKDTNEHPRLSKITWQTELQSKGSQSAMESETKDREETNTESPVPSTTSSTVGCSSDTLDLFSLNIHRIEKDVQRCDRSYYFYTEKENLDKLRNVMSTYVWENLEDGYVQGMCDLVAPLLVIFDDEVMTYSCFIDLMKRMSANFPNGGAMDAHFNNLRSLIQVLDYEVFELMHANGDYTHFYFCYRWFLLDFKRELAYDDVFLVWEVIWSAKYVSSSSFVLFIAAALVQNYRDVIISNNMDFTDIIKFFNEMAERHDIKSILATARKLVTEIQSLVQDL